MYTILNELIVDRNTIEVSTKSTSAISIIRIQFHLQHSNGSIKFLTIWTLVWTLLYL